MTGKSAAGAREVVVPGGEGRAIEVAAGEYLSIIDLEGQQVADFLAVKRDNVREAVSPQQTRLLLARFNLKVGDQLFSQHGTPMFVLVRDDVGVHDLLVASCSRAMYRYRYGIEEHRNCRENLAGALAPFGVEEWHLSDPVNFFMNTPPKADGSYDVLPAASKAGDRVVLRALVDAVVAVSACPFDIRPLNGDAITPVKLVVGPSIA